MANDIELGMKVHQHLLGLGLETPMVKSRPEALGPYELKPFEAIQSCHHGIMESLGLDLNDDSLKDTPKRIAKMYCHEIFNGLDYANFPKCTTVENKMQYQEMVCVDQIEVKSMCEHHFLPFVGFATIAYIPAKKVLGLSKFNRVTDFFSRRPQIQERLTEQVSAALRLILETEDVAVVIRSSHFCVKLRGVEDSCSDTITSRLSGKFRTVDSLRAEFLALSRGGK
jgi:GTP cyclohydrolase I